MAFGGNAGAAGGLLAVAAYVPSPGAAQAAYNGNNLEYQEADGSLVKEADVTVLVSITGGALAAYADNTVTGSAADTGVLTTAAAAANEHGLPANFGPGRGNWTAQDIHRLNVDVLETQIAAPTSTPSLKQVDLDTGGGDLTLVFKNAGADAIDILSVRLRFDHTMIF